MHSPLRTLVETGVIVSVDGMVVTCSEQCHWERRQHELDWGSDWTTEPASTEKSATSAAVSWGSSLLISSLLCLFPQMWSPLNDDGSTQTVSKVLLCTIPFSIEHFVSHSYSSSLKIVNFHQESNRTINCRGSDQYTEIDCNHYLHYILQKQSG